MSRRLSLVLGSALFLMAYLGSVGSGVALAQPESIAAEVRSGNCEGPGTLVAPLTPASAPAGATVGSPDALAAANSFTAIPVSLDVLVAEEHAVVIPSEDGSGTRACGTIGGPLTDSGALIIGLGPIGAGGFDGIAFLSPGTGTTETNVSLFLSGGSLSQQVGTPRVETELSTTAPLESVAPTTVAEQTNGVTAEEAAYVRTINPILAQMVESTDRFLILYTNPQVGDDDWSIAIVSEFVTWKQLHQQVSEIVPPPSLANLHSQLVGAFSLYAAAGTDIINGVDHLDPSLIDAADAKFARASDMFLNVRDQYVKLQAKLAP